MTLYLSTAFFASAGGAAAKPGMVLLTPTSIAHSGTSASIGANGQVTFTAVTSLTLEGIFSATYDNYVLSVRLSTAFAGGMGMTARLRVGGSDATGSNYTWQELYADGATLTAARTTNTNLGFIVGAAGPSGSTDYNGWVNQIYGPFLAQPTALRATGVRGEDGAFLQDIAQTHSLSTSYTGMTFGVTASTISGALQVYGVRG